MSDLGIRWESPQAIGSTALRIIATVAFLAMGIPVVVLLIPVWVAVSLVAGEALGALAPAAFIAAGMRTVKAIWGQGLPYDEGDIPLEVVLDRLHHVVPDCRITISLSINQVPRMVIDWIGDLDRYPMWHWNTDITPYEAVPSVYVVTRYSGMDKSYELIRVGRRDGHSEVAMEVNDASGGYTAEFQATPSANGSQVQANVTCDSRTASARSGLLKNELLYLKHVLEGGASGKGADEASLSIEVGAII